MAQIRCVSAVTLFSFFSGLPKSWAVFIFFPAPVFLALICVWIKVLSEKIGEGGGNKPKGPSCLSHAAERQKLLQGFP